MITQYKQGGASLNPDNIRVLNWNIQKASRPAFGASLGLLSRDVDLALLQEAPLDNSHLTRLADDWHHCFAPGFSIPGRVTTGVMTLSRAAHRTHQCLAHQEPVLRTPKATNLTTYALDGCDRMLLVINLHAVNFSLGMKAYRRQLQQVLPLIRQHRGPVIFAGDFNAWHGSRLQLLRELAREATMQEVNFEEDARTRFFGRHLDHVLVRDLQVETAHCRPVEGSDHNPMLVSLRF